MNLTRQQILKGNYTFPTELVTLKPTNHFKARLEERGLSVEFLPTVLRVTKDNIQSGKTIDGKRLNSVVVRLKYNTTKWLFIALNPNDGGTKTLWFRTIEKNEKRPNNKNNQQAIPDDRRKCDLGGD